VKLFGELDAFNPGGSVKDRTWVAMIETAARRGLIASGCTVFVGASSGNTGIALGFVCAAEGQPVSMFLPRCMSCELEALLRMNGASVEAVESMGGIHEEVDDASANG